jgi:hypothetical protein
VQVIANFHLSRIEMDALKFEAEHEKMTLDDLVGLIVRQNIPTLLDVMQPTKNEGLRQKLIAALEKENRVQTRRA